MLIGKNSLVDWGAKYLDFRNSTLQLDNGEVVPLNTMTSGHYGLELKRYPDEDPEITAYFLASNDDIDQKMETIKSVKKVHRALGHPLEEKMRLLYAKRGHVDKHVGNAIYEVIEKCNTCTKFKKKIPLPKTGLPKATNFNQVVSIDLKNVSSLIEDPADKRYVLYCVDEFSKWIKGAKCLLTPTYIHSS